MNYPIQLFVPTFHVEETLEAIRECLERGWTGMGYKTLEFEQAWKDYTHLPYAHFLNSATAGLHMAVAQLKARRGWQDGDEIITTPLTFVSTNHAILYEHLTPVFADVDQYLCLDPLDVEKKITPRTKAVMFVGLGGNMGQLRDISYLCERMGLKLIVDASHMAGTRYEGEHVPFGDVQIYSFQAVKNLPTADSGMICWRREDYDADARKLSWLGINKDTYARNHASGYSWEYDVEDIGWKYNGNSIMAAMGLVGLKYLEADNAYRRAICNAYTGYFAMSQHGDLIQHVPITEDCVPSRHLYQIMVENRDEVVARLKEAGIGVGVHYIDNTQYRMYQGNCPRAAEASKRLLSLPLHLRLSFDDVQRVATEVIKAVEGAAVK